MLHLMRLQGKPRSSFASRFEKGSDRILNDAPGGLTGEMTREENPMS
jgi:hypothetical protein